jgi:hypothetical protein
MGAFADSCAIPSTTHTVPARNGGTRSKHGATPSPTLQPSAPVTATSAERLINTRRSASTRGHLFALPALARNEADSSVCVNDSTRFPSGTVLNCPLTTALRLEKYDHAPPPNDSTRLLLSEFPSTDRAAVNFRSLIGRVCYVRVVRVACVKPTQSSVAHGNGAHFAPRKMRDIAVCPLQRYVRPRLYHVYIQRYAAGSIVIFRPSAFATFATVAKLGLPVADNAL